MYMVVCIIKGILKETLPGESRQSQKQGAQSERIDGVCCFHSQSTWKHFVFLARLLSLQTASKKSLLVEKLQHWACGRVLHLVRVTSPHP